MVAPLQYGIMANGATMSDLSQDSLLREIDEDIRRERYAKLWKRWGGFVIAGAVLLVAVVAGYQGWQYWTQQRREAAAAEFGRAMQLAERDRPAAEQALGAIAADGPPGYAMLAGFEQAALLVRSGDREGARAAYQNLQKSTGDAVYRDLATLLEAMVALQGEALPLDADAVRSRLQPLTAERNPWRFSARELTALIDWRGGDRAGARSQLSAMAADAAAPADVRTRAQQVLAQLGEG
jgi:hypothetical protein